MTAAVEGDEVCAPWVLVTARPFLPGDVNREIIGTATLLCPIAVRVQPIDPVSRELVPGALFVVPWSEVIQVVSCQTQADLRELTRVR